MIYINGKELLEVSSGITKVYLNGQLIWPIGDSLYSCFAKGYWINNEEWTNPLGWLNNI